MKSLLAAIDAERDRREQQRKERSQELYGHTGAHVYSIPPVTDETVLEIATNPERGEDRLVRLGDVLDALDPKSVIGTVCGPWSARVYLRRKFIDESGD